MLNNVSALINKDLVQLTLELSILTVNIGVVNRPHAKNSRKMTIAAWCTLGRPKPCS